MSTTTIPTKLYWKLIEAIADANCAWDVDDNLMPSEDWRELNAEAITEAHRMCDWRDDNAEAIFLASQSQAAKD